MLAVDRTDLLIKKGRRVVAARLRDRQPIVMRDVPVQTSEVLLEGILVRGVVGVIVLSDTAADVGIADVRCRIVLLRRCRDLVDKSRRNRIRPVFRDECLADYTRAGLGKRTGRGYLRVRSALLDR